jgi:hypothetical protein
MPRRTPFVLLRINLSEAITVSDSLVETFLKALKAKASAIITDTRPTSAIFIKGTGEAETIKGSGEAEVIKGEGEAKTIKGTKTKSLYEDG